MEERSAEENDPILWLPIFFTIGVFLRFRCLIDFKKSLVCLSLGFTGYSISYGLRKFRPLCLISIVLFFMAAGAIRTDRYISNHNFPTIKYNLGKVRLEGIITEKFSRMADNADYIVLEVERMEALNKNSRFAGDKTFQIPKKIRIKLASPSENVQMGRAVVEANIIPLENKYFDSDFDLKMYFYFKDIGGLGYGGRVLENVPNARLTTLQKISMVRDRMAMNMVRTHPTSSTRLLVALLTGRKNILDSETIKILDNSGLNYLLSANGLHVATLTLMTAIICKNISYFLRKIPFCSSHIKIFAISSLLLNSLLLCFRNFTVSSARVYLMNSMALFALLLDRFYDPLRALMFSTLLIIFAKPHLLFHSGLYLSFAPTLAILAFLRHRYAIFSQKAIGGSKYIESNNFLKNPKTFLFHYGMENLKLSSIVTLAILPTTIYSFNKFNPYGFLIHLLLSPLLIFIILPLGTLSLIFYNTFIQKIILLSLSPVGNFILFFAKLISQLPLANIAVPQVAKFVPISMIFAILLISLSIGWGRKIGFMLYIVALFSLFFHRNPDIVVDNRNQLLIFLSDRTNIFSSRKRVDAIYVYNLAVDGKLSKRQKNGVKHILSKILGNGDHNDYNLLTLSKSENDFSPRTTENGQNEVELAKNNGKILKNREIIAENNFGNGGNSATSNDGANSYFSIKITEKEPNENETDGGNKIIGMTTGAKNKKNIRIIHFHNNGKEITLETNGRRSWVKENPDNLRVLKIHNNPSAGCNWINCKNRKRIGFGE